MVNWDQDVMDRVHNDHGNVSTVSTGPLRDVFTLEPFNIDDSMLNDTEDVFDIDAVGRSAHPLTRCSCQEPPLSEDQQIPVGLHPVVRLPRRSPSPATELSGGHGQ